MSQIFRKVSVNSITNFFELPEWFERDVGYFAMQNTFLSAQCGNIFCA